MESKSQLAHDPRSTHTLLPTDKMDVYCLSSQPEVCIPISKSSENLYLPAAYGGNLGLRKASLHSIWSPRTWYFLAVCNIFLLLTDGVCTQYPKTSWLRRSVQFWRLGVQEKASLSKTVPSTRQRRLSPEVDNDSISWCRPCNVDPTTVWVLVAACTCTGRWWWSTKFQSLSKAKSANYCKVLLFLH